MRTPRSGTTVLGFALLVLIGCKTAEPELKPPKYPDVMALPPVEDAQLDQPPTFPKEKEADFLDRHKGPGTDVGAGPGTSFGSSAGGAGAGGMGGGPGGH